MSSTSNPLSFSALASYGLLALPLAFAGMPLYIHAPDFYATHYGVSLTALGLVLLGLRLFDAVQDPLIGLIIDRFSAARGAIMLWSVFALAAAFLMLFLPPLFSPLLWFSLAMAIATTAFSILSINLTALGGLWPHVSTVQLSRISGVRESFGLIGLLLAATLPPLLIMQRPAVQAFQIFSFVAVGLLLCGFFIFSLWYRKHFSPKNHKETSVFNLKFTSLLWQHRWFYLIYTLNTLASAFPAVLIMFFIRDRLEAENLTGLFLVLYFLSGALTMTLWQKLAVHRNTEHVWLLAMGLSIASFVWAYFLHSGDTIGYAIICVTSGTALGAELALPPAILAKKVKQQATESQATLQFSLLLFFNKMVLALAAGLALPLLDAVGFHTGESNSEAALQALSFGYALLPCLLKLIAATILLSRIIQNQGDIDHEKKYNRSAANGHINII